MSPLLASLVAGGALGLGVMAGLGWLQACADRRRARRWRKAQYEARRSALAHRRPQDDLEGWR